MFYLNEQFIGADSEAPYSITCSIEQEGDAKIEVLARDSVGNMNYDSVNIAHPRSKERTANPFIMMLFARFLLLQHFLKL